MTPVVWLLRTSAYARPAACKCDYERRPIGCCRELIASGPTIYEDVLAGATAPRFSLGRSRFAASILEPVDQTACRERTHLACASAIVFIACGDQTTPSSVAGSGAASVKFGFLVSGDRLTYWNAARIAVDEVNRRGGLSGRSVELVAQVELEDAEAAVRAAETMILTDQVSALIGPDRRALARSSTRVRHSMGRPHRGRRGKLPCSPVVPGGRRASRRSRRGRCQAAALSHRAVRRSHAHRPLRRSLALDQEHAHRERYDEILPAGRSIGLVSHLSYSMPG